MQPGGPAMEQWIMDARHAMRRLRRRPTYASLAVLTLALGIGGTAAVFGIVRRVLLDPLPYADEGSLALFWRPFDWTQQEFAYLRGRVPGFASVAQYRDDDATLEVGDGPARLVPGIAASHELFDVLGVHPVLGRTFEPHDDVRGAEPVAVVSYDLWQELGGQPSILGQRIRLGGANTTVIGVMGRGFWFPTPYARVWVPQQLDPTEDVGVVHDVAEGNLTDPPAPARYVPYTLLTFMAPGQTIVFKVGANQRPAALLPAVQAAMRQVAPRVAVQEATTMDEVLAMAVGPVRQIMALVAPLTSLALVLGAVGIYGVMSHFVARRRRDWGIRIALGLNPARVLSGVVGHGISLIALGIGFGLGAFMLLARLLTSLIYGIGTTDPVAIGGAVVALALVGAVAALVPAVRASRTDPVTVLREQ
jgi:hypothetical protein